MLSARKKKKNLLEVGAVFYLIDDAAVDRDQARSDARLDASSADALYPGGDPGVEPELAGPRGVDRLLQLDAGVAARRRGDRLAAFERAAVALRRS